MEASSLTPEEESALEAARLLEISALPLITRIRVGRAIRTLEDSRDAWRSQAHEWESMMAEEKSARMALEAEVAEQKEKIEKACAWACGANLDPIVTILTGHEPLPQKPITEDHEAMKWVRSEVERILGQPLRNQNDNQLIAAQLSQCPDESPKLLSSTVKVNPAPRLYTQNTEHSKELKCTLDIRVDPADVTFDSTGSVYLSGRAVQISALYADHADFCVNQVDIHKSISSALLRSAFCLTFMLTLAKDKTKEITLEAMAELRSRVDSVFQAGLK